MNDRALKVLEQYDLEVFSTRRGRGSYICETSQGLKALCDFEGSEKKMGFQKQVLEGLRQKGYLWVDPPLESKEGKFVVMDRDGSRYIVKDWFYGRECSSLGEQDVLDAVENLARLHSYLCFPEKEREYCGEPLGKKLEARTRELKKVRAFIRKQEPKHVFEQLFLKSFSDFFEQAQWVMSAAKSAECESFWKAQIAEGKLCHGDYNHHHIVFLDQEIGTTNFAKCRFDMQILDLGQFLRKIMEKQNWDLKLADRMLNVYAGKKGLSEQERRILYLHLAYPEKFWKLANHYYGSRKVWIPARYLQKLELLNSQQEQRKRFLKLLE